MQNVSRMLLINRNNKRAVIDNQTEVSFTKIFLTSAGSLLERKNRDGKSGSDFSRSLKSIQKSQSKKTSPSRDESKNGVYSEHPIWI